MKLGRTGFRYLGVWRRSIVLKKRINVSFFRFLGYRTPRNLEEPGIVYGEMCGI
jgi:hypothetical protein